MPRKSNRPADEVLTASELDAMLTGVKEVDALPSVSKGRSPGATAEQYTKEQEQLKRIVASGKVGRFSVAKKFVRQFSARLRAAAFRLDSHLDVRYIEAENAMYVQVLPGKLERKPRGSKTAPAPAPTSTAQLPLTTA